MNPPAVESGRAIRLTNSTRWRFRRSLIAVAIGWAAAVVVTLPMQFVKIVANATGGPGDLLWSLAAGALIWGAWSLAIAAGGWLLGFVPLIVFVPDKWFLQHPRVSIITAAALGWMVILLEFEVWKLLQPYHALEVRMFTLYSLLFIVFTGVSAAVYIRLAAKDSIAQ
jgi:hypothetical protein